MGEAAAAGLQAVLRIHTAVAGHAQTGDEIHPLVVCPVDKHGEGVEAAVDEALHVVPHAPVCRLFEGRHVGAEAHAHPGGVEQAISPLDAVTESVHRGARRFVYRHPGVRQGHGRLEDEQVVVPGVVEVDDSLAFHRGL